MRQRLVGLSGKAHVWVYNYIEEYRKRCLFPCCCRKCSWWNVMLSNTLQLGFSDLTSSTRTCYNSLDYARSRNVTVSFAVEESSSYQTKHFWYSTNTGEQFPLGTHEALLQADSESKGRGPLTWRGSNFCHAQPLKRDWALFPGNLRNVS